MRSVRRDCLCRIATMTETNYTGSVALYSGVCVAVNRLVKQSGSEEQPFRRLLTDSSNHGIPVLVLSKEAYESGYLDSSWTSLNSSHVCA
jgi:hypothetical protein